MLRYLNLLPPERRAHLRRGAFVLSGIRVVRFLIVGLSLVSIAGVLLVIGMWVIGYFYAGSETVELQTKVSEYIGLRETISENNQLLRLVNDLGNDRIVWSDYLADFLETIPPGTMVHSITGDARVGIFEFSGVTLTRNALVVFEERLSGLAWVSSVAAPRQNLLKKDNPDYTFELRLKGFEDSE